MTNEMTSFLEELKELIQKHNAKIAQYYHHKGSYIDVSIGEQSICFEYGLNVDDINDVLNTPQLKLKVGQTFYWDTLCEDVTVKTATLNENGETIVTFEEIGDSWTYSQLQTLGVV